MSIFNNGNYFLNAGIAKHLGSGVDATHYTMIHFVADSVVFEAITDKSFPGLVNMAASFLGSSPKSIGGGTVDSIHQIG